LSESQGWKVRSGRSLQRFSDRVVVQAARPGMLDISVCLVAGRERIPGGLGLLGSLVAASTSEGIRRDTGIVSWLHWPDLVTIDDRVVARTSLSVASPSKPPKDTRVVARILVDCFPPNTSAFSTSGMRSTSILEALGVEIDLDMLRDKVLHALNWYHAEWERGMHKKLVDRMRPTIAWLGSDVEVVTSKGRHLRGKAKGLDDLGALLLDHEDGRGEPKTRRLRPQMVDHVRVVD
jgi:hypothetical protein